VFLRQILFTGFDALGIVILTSLSIGALIIVQANSVNENFAQSQMLYTILVTIITRELATILPALIIVARSGTAISTELGNMVLNDEVEAVVSFGISPISYLVIPRLFAVIFALLPLAIFFNFFSMAGSGVIAFLFFDIDVTDFILKLTSELKLGDFLFTFVKCAVFGWSIGMISCYNGLKVFQASTEVPQRTSKAVVQSLAAIIIADILVVFIANLL